MSRLTSTSESTQTASRLRWISPREVDQQMSLRERMVRGTRFGRRGGSQGSKVDKRGMSPLDHSTTSQLQDLQDQEVKEVTARRDRDPRRGSGLVIVTTATRTRCL